MFETSERTEKLDEALAKAQGELEPAIFDSKNPHFGNKFASLTSVRESMRSVFAKYEISCTQWPIYSPDGKLHLVTRLAHKGEWMRSTFAIPITKQDPQGFGSAMTYARRYALAAAIGSVSDEDDDAEQAMTRRSDSPQANRSAQTSSQVKTPAPPPKVAPQASGAKTAFSGSALEAAMKNKIPNMAPKSYGYESGDPEAPKGRN